MVIVQESQEKYYFALTEKKSRAKEKILKIEEQVKHCREKQIHDNEEYIQNLVEKLVQKEEGIKRILRKAYR